MRIVTLRSSSSAPQIASLTFMRGEEPLQRLEFPAGAEIRPLPIVVRPADNSWTEASLHDTNRLHRRAKVRVRLGHELREFVRTFVDHAEAALGHEIVVFLAGGDLLDCGNQLVPNTGRHTLGCCDPAPGGHGPVTAGRRFRRRYIRIYCRALVAHHRHSPD